MTKWIKPIRTGIQVLLAVIPLVPFLIPALGLSATVGLGATLIGVATTASRLMALPAVEDLLEKFGLKTPE